ncbi:MAG: LamG domain-containing protein [Phycisphaerales bacterium]
MFTMKFVTAALAILSCAPVASASITPTNWWTFNQTGSGTALDAAGGANGTLAGPAVMAAGGISNGCLDVREGGWANMGNILPETGGASFSMSVWIATSSTSTSSTIIAGRHITGTFNGYMMRVNADTGGYGIATRASFYQSNSPANTAVGTSDVTDGVLWHHLVATYAAGGNLNLYVDGALQASIPTQTINANAANFIVGGVFSTPNSAIINSFNGLIDELQMYDRAITPAEVEFLRTHPGQAIPAPGAAAAIGLTGLLTARRRR